MRARTKVLLVMLAILLLTVGQACAVGLDPVPESRISFTSPDSAITATKEDGWLRISVNTANTDWEQLLYQYYDADMGIVMLPVQILAPAGGESYVYTEFRYKDGKTPPDEVFYDVLSDAANNNAPEARNKALAMVELARYVESSSMMQPSTIYKGFTFCLLVRWFDQSNNEVCSEQLNVSITFTSDAMFKIDRKKVPASSIRGAFVSGSQNNTLVELSESVYSRTINDGDVLYEIPDVADVAANDLTTKVFVPQAVLNSGAESSKWRCRISAPGSSWEESIMGDAQSGYYITFTLPVPQENDQVESGSYSLIWECDGEVKDYGALNIRIISGDPLPWPEYVLEWKTISGRRMDMSAFSEISGAIDVSYTDEHGFLHFGMKGTSLPAIDGLEHKRYNPVVGVPDGAVAYSFHHVSMSEIYGSQLVDWYKDDFEKELFKTANRITLPDGAKSVTLAGSNLFMAYHPSSNGVSSAEACAILDDQTVYLPADMTGENAGTVQVVCWYKENSSDPFLIEYMIVTREEFVLTQETKAVTELPDESVTIPVFLIDSAHGKNDCYLIINTYPQSEGNYVYYELMLVERVAGQEDKPVALDPDLTYRIHIPYPKGVGKNSENITFIIRHLNQNHEVTEVFDETGSGGIERTENGVLITVKSLSPFEVVWYEAPQPAQLPQTGDDSSVLFWLLMGAACVAVGVMAARKRAA